MRKRLNLEGEREGTMEEAINDLKEAIRDLKQAIKEEIIKLLRGE